MHETPPVNPESIRASIAAALACEELKVRGDGHHFEALVVCAA
jgi:acid stress-induced BolA-like protein IbaG/YrbA